MAEERSDTMTDNPVFLAIGNLLVYWHGLFVMLGIIAGVALTLYLRRFQQSISGNQLLITSAAVLAAALVGGRVYFCWHGADMFSDKSQYLNLSNGGYSVYGALIGGFAAVVISALLQRISVGQLLDITSPGMALAIAVGRIGAAFSGDNLGPEVSASLFQRFPFALFSDKERIWRSALCSYQSLIALLICAAAVWLLYKKHCRNELCFSDGDVFLLFAVFFFVTQGVFESYRIDPLYYNAVYIIKLQTIPAGMPTGAIFSAAALSMFIFRLMHRKKSLLPGFIYAPLCAIAYFCYFNVVLRIELPNALGTALFILGCLGLLAIGLSLFHVFALPEKGAPASPVIRPRTAPQPPVGNRRRQPPRQKPSRSSEKVDYWS